MRVASARAAPMNTLSMNFRLFGAAFGLRRYNRRRLSSNSLFGAHTGRRDYPFNLSRIRLIRASACAHQPLSRGLPADVQNILC